MRFQQGTDITPYVFAPQTFTRMNFDEVLYYQWCSYIVMVTTDATRKLLELIIELFLFQSDSNLNHHD